MQVITKIKEFWYWFADHEDTLFSNPDNDDLLNELDSLLSRIHTHLGWELGPSKNARMYLAISPSLDPELIPIMREVLAGAYVSKKWYFVAGRQRRPWAQVLETVPNFCAGSEKLAINVACWRHLVFKSVDDKKYEVVLEAPHSEGLTPELKDEIAYIVVLGLLGETLVMEKIDNIDVVGRLEEKFRSKAKPIEWIPYAFGMVPLKAEESV